MATFQGDSLLAFNNSIFTKTDFQSIQRIGDSLKKSTSKGIKTVEKNGGIDNYILGLKNSKLNNETKKLKKAIVNKKS